MSGVLWTVRPRRRGLACGLHFLMVCPQKGDHSCVWDPFQPFCCDACLADVNQVFTNGLWGGTLFPPSSVLH